MEDSEKSVPIEPLWVCLLVPETFDELSERTGFSVEVLRRMYEYDKDFGLQTKIVVVEKLTDNRENERQMHRKLCVYSKMEEESDSPCTYTGKKYW